MNYDEKGSIEENIELEEGTPETDRGDTTGDLLLEDGQKLLTETSIGATTVYTEAPNYIVVPDTIISIAKSGFQKDSANGIGFDSSAGRFFIPSNTINTDMVEDIAITSTKIENSSITTAKIQNGAVTNPKIGNFAIEANNINSDAVTEPKIADDAVGQDQLKSLSTLLIKDVNGSTLKTIHGAGA